MTDSIIFSGSDYDLDKYRKSIENDNHIGKRVKEVVYG